MEGINNKVKPSCARPMACAMTVTSSSNSMAFMFPDTNFSDEPENR